MERAAERQSSPFAMSRKVADVFVIMKGEVPDSIFKNKAILTELQFHTSKITTTKGGKRLVSRFISSRLEEMTQPWARQSLVQLAPVWGRITDPQTVQTTTSDQSEHRFATIQQLSAGVRHPVNISPYIQKCNR